MSDETTKNATAVDNENTQNVAAGKTAKAQKGSPSASDKAEAKAAKKAQKAEAKAAKKAAKAKRPKMPRMLLFFSIVFAINFVATVVNLVFTSRDLVQYTPMTLVDWLNIVLEMVTLWMLWCRFKVTRHFVMCFTAFNMICGFVRTFIFTQLSDINSMAAYGHITGDMTNDMAFKIIWFILGSIADIILFLYFWRSKKTKAYLTEPFGIDRDSALGDYETIETNYRSWAFWRNIIIYYCFFSLAGHWMESGFCMLIRMGIVAGEVDLNNTMLWRDWFYPFPMEGLAVAIIAVALYPLFAKLREKISIPGVAYLVSFIINGLVCVSIEYVMGMFVNADLQLWDYSNMPFNLNGMICLQNGLGFAAASSIICWIVYPMLERFFAKLPKNVMNLIFVVTVAAYAIPQALYLTDSPVPYRQELETVLADSSLDETSRAYYQSELDKLNDLEQRGVTLAGPSEDK
jgi:uncharacterized membrane protein